MQTACSFGGTVTQLPNIVTQQENHTDTPEFKIFSRQAMQSSYLLSGENSYPGSIEYDLVKVLFLCLLLPRCSVGEDCSLEENRTSIRMLDLLSHSIHSSLTIWDSPGE